MTDSKGKPSCPQRKPPEYRLDKEVIAKLSENADVLSNYGEITMNHIYRKHYSLQNNMYLNCSWSKFKDAMSTRVQVPCQLPGQSDEHFHNQRVKLLTSTSIYMRKSIRKSLKPGPGVDYGGQMPIPYNTDQVSTKTVPKKSKEKITKDNTKLKEHLKKKPKNF